MKANNPYGLLPDLTGLIGAIAGDNKAQKIGANVLSGCLASYGYGAS